MVAVTGVKGWPDPEKMTVPGIEAQDEAGSCTTFCTMFPFALNVRNDNRRPKLVKFFCPENIDDPRLVITVTLNEEWPAKAG